MQRDNSSSYCVYLHTCPSGKVYVGMTGRSPKARWERGKHYKDNTHFTNAVNLYGWDAIEHEILFSGLTKEAAENKEKALIFLYNATDRAYGYNKALGGSASQLGRKRTPEERKRISEGCKKSAAFKEGSKRSAISRTGRTLSEITKAKISARHKGRGRKQSEESKKKISNTLKGRTLSESHKSALRMAATKKKEVASNAAQ